ncbi:MAG: glycosyltransferase family 2 protein [Burkholderiaceae bacterium]
MNLDPPTSARSLDSDGGMRSTVATGPGSEAGGRLDKRPLATVGLTTYKAERYIGECLDSLLDQSVGDFEIVISDNGSPDRTVAVCQDYAARDSRIRVIASERNLGVAANLNRAFALGRGEYFCWASANDWYHPRFLERCIAPMQQDPDIDLVASQITVFEDDRRLAKANPASVDGCLDDDIDRFIACLRLRDGRLFRGVFRTDAVRDMVPLSSRFGQDIITIARVAAQGKVMLLDEEPYYFVREAPGTVTHKIPPHQRVSHYEPVDGLKAYVLHRTRNQAALWAIALRTARGGSGLLRAIRGMLGVSWRWRRDFYTDLRDIAGLARGYLRVWLGRA